MRPPLSKRRISKLIYVGGVASTGYRLFTAGFNNEDRAYDFNDFREAFHNMHELREDAHTKPWLFPHASLTLGEWAKIHAYRRRQLDVHHNLSLQE